MTKTKRSFETLNFVNTKLGKYFIASEISNRLYVNYLAAVTCPLCYLFTLIDN